MPDEEEKFTFVDKRRTQAEPAPQEPAAAAPPPPSDTADVDAVGADTDYEDQGGPAPDIYSVLGYCVSLLSAEAWHKLGLLADPQTGQAQPDLPQAKVAIDAVGDLAARLETAPAEFVPESLRRDLRTLLKDLRLNYVAQQNQPA